MSKSPIYIIPSFLVLFALGFMIARWTASRDDSGLQRTQIALGTTVVIQVRGAEEDAAQRAMNAAFAEVRRIDTLFSTYQENGPVWRFNHSTESPVNLPAEILWMLSRCDSINTQTNGAFDVLIQPLVEVWGFEGGSPAIPDPEVLRSALTLSGWSHLGFREGKPLRRDSGSGLNFGAIAKGYAVDRAILVLEEYGIRDVLVNAGGEIRAIGRGWQVGIQHPREEASLLAVVIPGTKAVATSGDYEQYFERDGQRYHHILDPSTGEPARGCRSVTVLADDVLTADALATAVFVMGPERGMKFIAASKKYEALIVDSVGTVTMSPGFESYTLR